MTRVTFIALLLATAACRSEATPVQTAGETPILFRGGGGGEVRLRCGSETLRARLRQGQVLAQVGNDAPAVLAPVEDPRAGSGPAYSDGQLTLYKVPEAQNWALARGPADAAPCTRDTSP